jgi:hypothetical protein
LLDICAGVSRPGEIYYIANIATGKAPNMLCGESFYGQEHRMGLESELCLMSALTVTLGERWRGQQILSKKKEFLLILNLLPKRSEAMKAKVFVLALLLAVFCPCSMTYADVPQMINYHGQLTTPQGELVDTTVSMTFAIYADSVGGEPLWSETQDSVNVEKGVFSVLLGSENPIQEMVFDDGLRYLGVKVGSDSEMTPRNLIASVGYAFRSQYADSAEYALAGAGGKTDEECGWERDKEQAVVRLQYEDDKVGIGTPLPGSKLEICSNDYVGISLDGNTMKAINTCPGSDQQRPPVSVDLRLKPLGPAGDVIMEPGGSGGVGIGVSVPQAKLHVKGDMKVTGPIIAYGQDLDERYINHGEGEIGTGDITPGTTVEGFEENYVLQLKNAPAGVGCRGLDVYVAGGGTGIRSTSPDGIGILAKSNNDYAIFSAGNAKVHGDLTVTGLGTFDGTGKSYFSGKLGIGTTNPCQSLHVEGRVYSTHGMRSGRDGTSSAALLELFNDRANWDNVLRAYDDNYNTLFIVQNGGNVGVGTSEPEAKLHVWGADSESPALVVHRGKSGQAFQGLQFWAADRDAYIRYEEDAGEPSAGKLHLQTGLCGTVPNDALIIDGNGNVGIGISDPDAKLTIREEPGEPGERVVLLTGYCGDDPVVEIGKGLDYSETFPLAQDEITPGMVTVIDPVNKGHLTISTQEYDSKVAGIVAGAKGLGSGVRLGSQAEGAGDLAVALAGRVYCNVDTQYGDIKPGDLLTTSPTPGHAMKVKDFSKAQGAILGKAMEGLSGGGKRQILVLVSLQ